MAGCCARKRALTVVGWFPHPSSYSNIWCLWMAQGGGMENVLLQPGTYSLVIESGDAASWPNWQIQYTASPI